MANLANTSRGGSSSFSSSSSLSLLHLLLFLLHYFFLKMEEGLRGVSIDVGEVGGGA